MSLKRSRTGSFALVTQDAGFSANSSSYSSGGYARPRSKGYNKLGRKGSRMYRPNVNAAIRAFNWRQRETKMISTFSSENVMNTLLPLSYVIPFPVPQLGTGANNRTGNKIEGVGLKMKLLLNNNASLPILVRVMIIRIPQGDKFTDAQVSSALFETSSTSVPEVSAAPTGLTADLIRQVNRGELQVIRDKVVPLLGTSVDTGVAMEEVYVRIPGIITLPDSNALTQMSARYVVVMLPRRSDSDESVGSVVEYSITLTKYFKDK